MEWVLGLEDERGGGVNWTNSKGYPGCGFQSVGVTGKPDTAWNVGLVDVKTTLARVVSCLNRARIW